MDLLPVVQQAIQHNDMLTPGETVVVGVSGGPDSLCLLHLLQRLAASWRLHVHVAHLNHSLRGADADADAAFVEQTAAASSLPCTVERTDVRGLAQATGASLEEAARHARYAFLARVAARLNAAAIAVGHNADDQVETVLMHFLRGSGLAGLRGMAPVTALADYRLLDAEVGDQRSEVESRKSKVEGQEAEVGAQRSGGEGNGLRLVRPLLFVPRADILAYCDAHGLQPRFDRSNEDTTFFRNRLRHELLPLLETYNPQIRRVLRHTAAVIADDYALLRSVASQAWADVFLAEADGALIFDLGQWRALPTSLQRSVLREAINRLRRSLRNVSFVHVENALWELKEGEAGARMTLPAGLEVVLGYDQFAVGEEGVELPLGDLPQMGQAWMPLAVPGVASIAEDTGWHMVTELLAPADLPPTWQSNVDRWQAWLDADAMGLRPALRSRQEGDRFQPLGMDGRSKSLAEFFTNAKVPANARAHWPLLVTSAGDIAWVCGLRVDKRASVTPATQQVLHVVLRR